MVQHRDACRHRAKQRCGHTDQQQIEQVDVAVGDHQTEDACRSRRDGAGGDGILGCDDGSRDGALRPDARIHGDLIDDRQQAVNDVAGAAHKGEDVSDDRSKDGDVLRVFPQDLLSKPDHVVQTARSLHCRCCQNDRDHDADDGDGRVRRGNVQEERQDKHADTAGKCHERSALAGSDEDHHQNDE